MNKMPPPLFISGWQSDDTTHFRFQGHVIINVDFLRNGARLKRCYNGLL